MEEDWVALAAAVSEARRGEDVARYMHALAALSDAVNTEILQVVRIAADGVDDETEADE